MKIKLVFFFLLTSLFSYGQGRVDGFYKAKGEFDFVIGGGYENNKNYFAGKNKIALPRKIAYANMFVKYGISNRLNVSFSLPYMSINGVESSFQDASLFFKYSLFNKYYDFCGFSFFRRTLSIATGISTNLSNYKTEGGNAIGQQAKIIDFRVVLHNNYNNETFLTIQTGYSYKFNPVPNSLPFAIKYGFTKSKFYADFWYEYQYSFGGLDYKGTPSPLTFRELGVNYHKIGATFYKPIKNKFGIFVGVSYLISGRNTSQGLGINAGIVLKHNKE